MTRRRAYDVAFYVPWIGPLLTYRDTAPAGGAETQIFLVAHALARAGLRVCLIAFELEGIELPTSRDGLDVVMRPPYQSKRGGLFGKLRETLAIWRAVLAADAAVVVTRAAGPHVGIVAVAARTSGRRFVYSSANVSDFDFAILAPNRRDRALFALGVRLADEVVVQTSEQVELCRERFGRPARLIRSVAEPAEPRPAEPEAFLWIGRLVWYKRPLEFLELARRVPEARFWLVGVPVPFAPGGPELVASVEQAASELPNVELLPPRPRPQVLELIERAVAVVNTADFEGLPNILLEGWSRGVPALVLTHDPDGIVAAEGLGHFAHGEREAMALAAQELWSSRHDQEELAQRCRRYVREQHAPEAVAQQWRRLLLRDPTVPMQAVAEVP